MTQNKNKMFKNPLKKYQQGGQVSQEEQQMLAAFVEWLPKRVKEFQGMQPEQIVEALNGMSKSPEGQKQVQAYMQQFQKEMQTSKAGMFKDGGKLQDFICKHAKGGHVAGCGCKEDGGKVEKAEDGYKVKNGSYEASVKAPGDTTRSKQYNYTTENMRTYPTGAVRYQTTSNNDGYTTTSWDYRKTMPTFWQRVGSEGFLSAMLNRPRRVSPTTKENWENIIANHPEDPRNALKKENGGVVKGQEGTTTPTLSRREALSAAMEAYGFNEAQARTAYANAKRALRNSGLRGKALKQAAREMISRRRDPQKVETIQSANIQAPVLTAPMKMTLSGQAPKLAPNYYSMSFNNAFRAARNISQNGGSSTFNWRGKSYGTNIASGPKLPILSDDIQIEEPEIDLNIPEIPVEQLYVPMIGTTPTARSLRTVSTTPFIDSISGARQVVSRVPVKTAQTTNSNPIQPRPTTGPVKEVRTSVGTGYYPVDTRGDIDTFVGRSEYEMRQLMNQDNNSRMPSIRWGRFDYQPIQTVESNIPREQVTSVPQNLVYRKKGGIITNK